MEKYTTGLTQLQSKYEGYFNGFLREIEKMLNTNDDNYQCKISVDRGNVAEIACADIIKYYSQKNVNITCEYKITSDDDYPKFEGYIFTLQPSKNFN